MPKLRSKNTVKPKWKTRPMAVPAAQVPRRHKSTKMSGETVHKKALLEQQRIEQQRKKQKKASFNRRFRISTTPRLADKSPPATAAKAVGGSSSSKMVLGYDLPGNLYQKATWGGRGFRGCRPGGAHAAPRGVFRVATRRRRGGTRRADAHGRRHVRMFRCTTTTARASSRGSRHRAVSR